MISVIRHIEYLISEHDCVIIPGWGALIAQYNHGYVREDMICPPSRVISFNSDINNNDGLLANSIVRREGVSYEKALSLIADEVSSYHIQLSNGGEIAFNRIGLFTTNGDGSVGFTPFNDGKIKNDLYGFQSFTFSKLVTEDTATEQAKDNNVIYIPVSRNIFRVAASIVMLIGLTLLLSTPITVNNIQNYASMGVMNNNVEQVVEQSNRLTPQVEVVEVVETPAPTVEVVAEQEEEIAKPATTTASKGYYLIVGAFDTQEAAEVHISHFKSRVSELNILYTGHKYMVYAATGKTFSSLKPIYNDMQSSVADAWIYKFK